MTELQCFMLGCVFGVVIGVVLHVGTTLAGWLLEAVSDTVDRLG